jgi:hypothetical protein
MVHIGTWALEDFDFELDSSMRKFKPVLARYGGPNVTIKLRIFAKHLPSVVIPIQFSATEIKDLVTKGFEPAAA